MDYRLISLTNHLQAARGDLINLASTETDEQQEILSDMEHLADRLEIKLEVLKQTFKD